MHGKDFSITEKLTLAAYEIEKSNNKQPFSSETLAVTAWKKFPDAFGLHGFRGSDGKLLYPDSNRVYAEIMGSKPIRKKGYLIKVGSKMYQLTEAGREYAKFLLTSKRERGVQKASLPREIEITLKKLLANKAVEKYKANRSEEISFYDACAFLGINPGSTAIELEGKIANIDKIVDLARKIVKENAATFEHGGIEFSVRDLDVLIEVKRVLINKFENEMQIIKKRRKENY